MNRFGFEHPAWLLAMVLLSTAAAAQATLPGGATVHADLEAGLQYGDVNGSAEKFEEFRDMPRGLLIPQLRLEAELPSARYVDVDIREPLQSQESYQLSAGQRGKYRFFAQYDATPHRFASARLLFGQVGSGYLRVADVARRTAEANEQTGAERSGGTLNLATDPNLDRTGEDAVQQSIAQGLYEASDRRLLRLDRRDIGAGFEMTLGKTGRAWVAVKNEDRDGTRPSAAGTYERWNVGSGLTHTIDRFLVNGADLAEPIDYRTLTVTAGTGVYRQGWMADVDYRFTHFRNFVTALRWDNPFRATDAVQVGGVDRGRTAVGQLALPPDSQSHDFGASGAVELPLHGRLAARVSYGLITQRESFVPYTLNSAMLATNVPGSPRASELELPQGDLNGDVRTLGGTVSLALQPVEPVGVQARYQYYVYDSRTPSILFPGYAGFGESGWRTVKNDKNAPVENEAFDITRHDALLRVDGRFIKGLNAFAEGGWEGSRFKHLRIGAMDELRVGGGVAYRPVPQAAVEAAYHYSDRTTDPYLKGRTPENPEATGLINFNWAERRRHDVQARVRLSPTPLLSASLSGRGLDETYDGTSEGDTEADRFRFGRTDARSVRGAVDAVLAPTDRIAFNAFYAHEYRRERLASAAKDDGPKATPFFGFEDDYAPVNYWNSKVGENIDTIGVGGTAEVIRERLLLDLRYDLSRSTMDIDTSNPNGVSETTLANAIAVDWRPVRNRLHHIEVDLGYRLSPEVRAGVRYLFEWYDLDDFAWNPMEPYMAGRTVENSTRFAFSDATYDRYQANFGMLYLSGRF